MDEGDYYHLAYYKYKTLMSPTIQNVADCTKKIFQTEYGEAKGDLEDYLEDEDDDGALSIAALITSVIFALLIIL
jgi:hypothetical protein